MRVASNSIILATMCEHNKLTQKCHSDKSWALLIFFFTLTKMKDKNTKER